MGAINANGYLSWYNVVPTVGVFVMRQYKSQGRTHSCVGKMWEIVHTQLWKITFRWLIERQGSLRVPLHTRYTERYVTSTPVAMLAARFGHAKLNSLFWSIVKIYATRETWMLYKDHSFIMFIIQRRRPVTNLLNGFLLRKLKKITLQK